MEESYAYRRRLDLATMTRNWHAAAGLLKLYLRELNPPLLSFELYPFFLAVGGSADAVLRAHVEDDPSPFALHYAGRAAPRNVTRPFGISLAPLEAESEHFSLLSPAIAAARVKALTYAARLAASLAPEHTVFAFERSMRAQPAEPPPEPPAASTCGGVPSMAR